MLNVEGFYDPLVTFLQRAASDGFIREMHVGLISVEADPEKLLERLAAAELPEVAQWIDSP